MEPEQLKFILEELRFSADLPPNVIQSIAEVACVRHLRQGAYVFREGLENRDLFLVRSGRIALEMNVPGRGPVRILTVGSGEMIGWSALLGAGKMTASALVVEVAELVVSPAEKLQQECEASSEFGFHLMRQMADALSRRLVATRLQLLDLFAESDERSAMDSLGEER
ncbi:MAG: Crp/Fnr family transcriptional regulator [Pirellulaceae bacterium]|nr:Crp/Fnr family transcriptional regulator [Pirellulaceae bacterium]